MKVAIIEEDSERLLKLNGLVSGHKWKVDFFRTPKDFGRVDLSGYDVVVADCSLPTMHGRDLLKSISGKTVAQMLLMSDSTAVFSQEDIENENINGLVHDPEDLLDQLGYLDSKIRINRMMEQESDRINGLLSNGFSLSVKENVGILDINNMPTPVTMNRMETEIRKLNLNGLVICFAQETLNSAHLGVLVSLYKRFKKLDMKLAFWNRFDNPHVTKLLEECNLDNLYGIYSDLKKATTSVSG